MSQDHFGFSLDHFGFSSNHLSGNIEQDVDKINYVPDSGHQVTVNHINSSIDCPGCRMTFGSAVIESIKDGEIVKKVCPHFTWYQHCYKCMKFAELGKS